VARTAGAEQEGDTMAEHPNVALVRRATQAMTELDMSKAQQEMPIVDAFMADDIVWHQIGRTEPLRGKDELRAAMMEGARDWTIAYDLHDVIANDDHAIALGTATATRGGKTLVYRTAEIFHIRDGRATERWAFSDDTEAITAFFA
jgi:ketosteroid isomerase-like protein